MENEDGSGRRSSKVWLLLLAEVVSPTATATVSLTVYGLVLGVQVCDVRLDVQERLPKW